MAGGTIFSLAPKTDSSRKFQSFGRNLLCHYAMLQRQRHGEVLLDKAFSLIEGHPSCFFNFLWTLLEGFEDFDFAFFAEDVYGDACGITVDDYVAVGAGDA
jgi:hypothetical protein